VILSIGGICDAASGRRLERPAGVLRNRANPAVLGLFVQFGARTTAPFRRPEFAKQSPIRPVLGLFVRFAGTNGYSICRRSAGRASFGGCPLWPVAILRNKAKSRSRTVLSKCQINGLVSSGGIPFLVTGCIWLVLGAENSCDREPVNDLAGPLSLMA